MLQTKKWKKAIKKIKKRRKKFSKKKDRERIKEKYIQILDLHYL